MTLAIDIVKVIAIPSIILTFIPVLIWWERKGAAYIQDRRGPNRASILGFKCGGFFHNFADVLKLFFKEDIIPTKADKVLFVVAPMIVFFVVVATSAVIPLAAPLMIKDHLITFQIADINIGLIYILAIASLSVYGVLLAGWSSNSAYSLFGGLRASAQMISYEVAMGLALVSVIMYAGSVRLDEIVLLQGTKFWDWNFAREPLAFVIFLTCLFAEANRNPFDLPEGESELVAGFHTEYSSMKFALFFMGEYAHMVVGSMILVSLFFGGWQIPFASTELLNGFLPSFVVPFLQIGCFITKTLFFCWFFIWVRWTLPRFRYDQLMGLGWKGMVPLAIINIIFTGLVLYAGATYFR
ncbi:MAG: NADH-quinone oxidoreductase subunit NuoH [Deltaproteobacteria bacterium CG11_big_fil_rev_8_21_14_0_20_49_13]|nr:MAG: NADH-quinone oxidoreductase subunit NuoH [Deltaproteobacteria bacterium CG11_big_fil_rev_8_21_14_0_20_49_13]